jgi:hypothetical protein
MSYLKMSIKYKFYKEEKLLVEVLESGIEYSDLMLIMETLVIESIHNGTFRIISDIRNAHFNFSVDEIVRFANNFHYLESDSPMRWAILTLRPEHVAYSELLKSNEILNQFVGVFSTFNACSKFIGVNYTEFRFKKDSFEILKK